MDKCSDINGKEVEQILQENYEPLKFYLLNYTPLAFVNGRLYRGSYDSKSHFLNTVCAAVRNDLPVCSGLEHEFALAHESSIFWFVMRIATYALLLSLAI